MTCNNDYCEIEKREPKLKPCPFCGDKYPFAENVRAAGVLSGTGINNLVVINCGNCTANVVGASLEDAVKRWNERA